MTPRRQPLITFALALLIATLPSPQALSEDTVITKSGRTYVGEILEKNSSIVTIRYKVSQGIIDTVTVNRSDVAEIISESADLVAYNALKGILPTADMLAAADYQKLIDGTPADFLKTHPTSIYKPEVNRIISTLKSELARVTAGDRKVDGEWLTKEEVRKNRFNIDASVLFAEMEAHAASGDTLQALKTFEKIEADYPVSKAFVRAVPAVLEIADQHKTALNDLLIQLPDRLVKRQDTSNLEPAAAARAKNAIRMDDAKWAKIRKDEERAKVKWRSVHAVSESDITKAIKDTNNEVTRLKRVDLKSATRVAEAAAAGFVAFEEKDYKRAISHFSAASAGTRHPLISDFRSRAEKLYQQQLKDTEAERAAAKLEASLAEQQGSTIAPRSSPPPKSRPTPPESKPAPTPEEKPVAVVTSEKRTNASGGSSNLRTLLVAALVVVMIGMIAGNIIARKKGVPAEED